MTTSKTGLLVTILVVLVVVALVGFGLRFLINRLVHTVQAKRARDEEEAEEEDAEADSEAATAFSAEPPTEALEPEASAKK